MKPKRTLSAYILLVGIMGLSIVGGLVAYQLARALTKSQVSTEQETLIKPIDGQIDSKVTDNLYQRRKYSVNELESTILVATPTPTAVAAPTPTEVATGAASIQQ